MRRTDRMTFETDEYVYEMVNPCLSISNGYTGYRIEATASAMKVITKGETQPVNIYYIRYRDDSPDQDGIWLFTEEDDKQFFLTRDGATSACAAKNGQDRLVYEARKEKARVKWDLDDVAFRALERAGIDARKTLPYHKAGGFEYQDYKPMYVIDQIEVQE